jgi:hypothetical protein
MITLQMFLRYYMVVGAILVFANVIWAFRDARSRGRSGFLISFLVLSTFPRGVLLWMCARPDLLFDHSTRGTLADPDGDIKRRANEGLL